MAKKQGAPIGNKNAEGRHGAGLGYGASKLGVYAGKRAVRKR